MQGQNIRIRLKAYDHRLLDGKDAVGFLICIKEQLESPQKLLLNL